MTHRSLMSVMLVSYNHPSSTLLLWVMINRKLKVIFIETCRHRWSLIIWKDNL